MPDFSDGIREYVHTAAVVYVSFPVNWKGEADICCDQCYYYRRNYKTCGLNGEVCQYPNKYVGGACPLKPAEEINNNMEDNT